MLLRWLMARAVFAPENDQGSGEPDDQDIDLDLDADDEPDDLPEDEDLDDVSDDEPVDDVDEPVEPPPRQLTRGESRQAVLARDTKAAKEEAAAARREIEDLRRQVSAPPQVRETPEARAARFAAMEPWDRTEALRVESENATNARLARMEWDAWDRGDRLEYESLAAREPIAAKLKDDVEKAIASERQQGRNPSRSAVLKYLIGERALAGKGRATGKAKRTAEVNRDRQTARPGNGRADVAASGRRGSDAQARAKRLEDMKI